MKKQSHLRHIKLCANTALAMLVASFIAHQLHDSDLSLLCLWLAVLLLSTGILQLVRYLTPPEE